jgi:hypothetical protein
MESVSGEIDKLTHTIPIVILFRSLNSVSASVLVLNGEVTSAGGMNDPKSALGGVMLRALSDDLSCSNVVAVGNVCMSIVSGVICYL